MSDSEWILVGVAGAPHGVRGELRLKSYTDPPTGLSQYASLWAGDPPTLRLKILSARALKDDLLVARLDGIDNRDAAQALTNRQLFVKRADLPPTGEDEFYHADLIGLDARDPQGASLGTVVALQNFGAGDLLEIAPRRGDTFYVPFTRNHVPTVDLKAGYLAVSAEALAEDPADEPAPDGDSHEA